MTPAVGITKILNNLEECVEIIEKIKLRNNVILPEIEHIEEFSKAKNELVAILANANLDNIEKTVASIKATMGIENKIDNLYKSIEIFLTEYKRLLKEMDISQDNAIQRIKLLRNQERISWFKDWKKPDHQFEAFNGIVTSYCNWEYPVLEIFPGMGDMLPFAVSGEPLYIVDWDEELLEDVTKQFNSYYSSKRLMKYKIDGYDLSALPQNSFGFVYSINFVNFENLTNLLTLAENVYNCLMPGGIYMFIYNNSDDYWSVENAAEYYFGLVGTKELSEGLTNLGFEIIQVERSKKINHSYIICKKPGEIDYIKKSSILAKVIDRDRV